jgi:hypothetical protein
VWWATAEFSTTVHRYGQEKDWLKSRYLAGTIFTQANPRDGCIKGYTGQLKAICEGNCSGKQPLCFP